MNVDDLQCFPSASICIHCWHALDSCWEGWDWEDREWADQDWED